MNAFKFSISSLCFLMLFASVAFCLYEVFTDKSKLKNALNSLRTANTATEELEAFRRIVDNTNRLELHALNDRRANVGFGSEEIEIIRIIADEIQIEHKLIEPRNLVSLMNE